MTVYQQIFSNNLLGGLRAAFFRAFLFPCRILRQHNLTVGIEKNILIKDNNSRLFLNLDSPIVKILNRTLDDFNKIEMERQMENLDEPFDVLSDEELDKVFDENASDVDLDKLEHEIYLNEISTLHIEYLDKDSNEFKLSFANI